MAQWLARQFSKQKVPSNEPICSTERYAKTSVIFQVRHLISRVLLLPEIVAAISSAPVRLLRLVFIWLNDAFIEYYGYHDRFKVCTTLPCRCIVTLVIS